MQMFWTVFSFWEAFEGSTQRVTSVSTVARLIFFLQLKRILSKLQIDYFHASIKLASYQHEN